MLLKEYSELLYIQLKRLHVCQCSCCKLHVLYTTKHVLVQVSYRPSRMISIDFVEL